MQIENTRFYVLSDGRFRLDGGAMFGVVPKALWNKLEPADAENRILMGLNCLLIVREKEKILIDTGIGNKYDEKFAAIYGIDQPENLLDQLARRGYKPEDITHVIMSHMHFDHIGWNTRYGRSGALAPTFANAVYYAQRGEFEVAQHPDPRSRASYLPANWEPLQASGRLHLIDGSGDILPGIESLVTGGHTAYHSIIKVTAGAQIVTFLADLVPTPSHLKTPYVMGYDLYPKQTMEIKPKILAQALREQWLLVFEHAASVHAGYLREQEGKLQVEPVQLSE